MLPNMKYLGNFADTKGKHSAIKMMSTAFGGKGSPSHSGQCLKMYFLPGTLFCKLMKKINFFASHLNKDCFKSNPF